MALLDDDAVAQFHEQGWLPPFELMPPERMAALRPELERIFDDTDAGAEAAAAARALGRSSTLRRPAEGRRAHPACRKRRESDSPTAVVLQLRVEI